MNTFSDITDEEFVPFLKNLGVETYGKSFEWMLTDPEFSGVLRWLYSNLDHSNALTAREDYRYTELENRGITISPKELEDSISALTIEYQGLTLPGDKEALEDVKQRIQFQKERIDLLERHGDTIGALIKQTELSKEELNREIVRLNALEKQSTDDVSSTSDTCLTLAEEVENITESIVDIVTDTISEYKNAHMDKEISKRFLTFGPFEAYKQSQRLFMSHFDLYTSRKFSRRHNHTDTSTASDTRLNIIEAKVIEKRLYETIILYIESVAELTGVQAMIGLVVNFDNVHPSQIPVSMMESKSGVELCEQEEVILKGQVDDAARSYCDRRTRIAADSAARLALQHRQDVYKELSWLHEVTQTALSLDSILYYAVRHELHNSEDLVQFAGDLRDYLMEEQAAVASRIDSMQRISSQQMEAEQRLETSEVLIESLCDIFGIERTNSFETLTKVENEIKNGILELREAIENEIMAKEDIFKEFELSNRPLREFINDGSTRLPNCRDRTVATLTHALRNDMDSVNRKVVEASGLYATVKNGDKNSMRKLWQWFLTDQPRLLARMKEIQSQ